MESAVPAACATADAARGEKCLPSGQVQANFSSTGTPLGECRLEELAEIRRELKRVDDGLANGTRTPKGDRKSNGDPDVIREWVEDQE